MMDLVGRPAVKRSMPVRDVMFAYPVYLSAARVSACSLRAMTLAVLERRKLWDSPEDAAQTVLRLEIVRAVANIIYRFDSRVLGAVREILRSQHSSFAQDRG
jgi:hypothetical protein